MKPELNNQSENGADGSELNDRLGALEAEVAMCHEELDKNWVMHQRVVRAETDREVYREALEQIRDATVDCNGGLLTTVHAIAQLALDPEGCKDLARIKDA
jgi:hypothetical protein